MTCGEWGKPGHEDHICINCTRLFQKRCEFCEIKGSCEFVPASKETIIMRDDLFRRKAGGVL